MSASKPKKEPTLGTALFVIISILAAVAISCLGWYLYAIGGKQLSDFYAKFGELLLQLAIIVIVGALVKTVVDWGTSQRDRYRKKLDDRRDLMRRTRAMHATVQNAMYLMNAHETHKTWGEQSRRLMTVLDEVEEISKDLEESGTLFEKQSAITNSLNAIIAYLQRAKSEYGKNHAAVDRAFKANLSLREAIDQNNMTWVRDFMDEGEDYKKSYAENFESSNSAMRRDVYGEPNKHTNADSMS